MTFQQTLTTLSLMMLISLSCGHIRDRPPYQDASPQIYCGRRLASAFAVICNDDFSNEKRSEAGTMYNSILTPLYKEHENNVGWPWTPRHMARDMGHPSRGKRSIVMECCYKPCSIEELLSYC